MIYFGGRSSHLRFEDLAVAAAEPLVLPQTADWNGPPGRDGPRGAPSRGAACVDGPYDGLRILRMSLPRQGTLEHPFEEHLS
jgi:hypothetical protein